MVKKNLSYMSGLEDEDNSDNSQIMIDNFFKKYSIANNKTSVTHNNTVTNTPDKRGHSILEHNNNDIINVNTQPYINDIYNSNNKNNLLTNNNNNVSVINKSLKKNNQQEEFKYLKQIKNIIKIKKNFQTTDNINSSEFHIPSNYQDIVNEKKLKEISKQFKNKSELPSYKKNEINEKDLLKNVKIMNKGIHINFFNIFEYLLNNELKYITDNYSEYPELIDYYTTFIKFADNFMRIVKKEYRIYKCKYVYNVNEVNILNENQKIYLEKYLDNLRSINSSLNNNRDFKNITYYNDIISNEINALKTDSSNNLVNNSVFKNNIKKTHKQILIELNNKIRKHIDIVI